MCQCDYLRDDRQSLSPVLLALPSGRKPLTQSQAANCSNKTNFTVNFFIQNDLKHNKKICWISINWFPIWFNFIYCVFYVQEWHFKRGNDKKKIFSFPIDSKRKKTQMPAHKNLIINFGNRSPSKIKKCATCFPPLLCCFHAPHPLGLHATLVMSHAFWGFYARPLLMGRNLLKDTPSLRTPFTGTGTA